MKMKKGFAGIFIAWILIMATSTTNAATKIQLKVDDVVIVTDVNPEMKNNRMMVPLRVISENLGAKVDWTKSQVTLTKSTMKVILKQNSRTAVVNGQTILLDTQPYVKNGRIFVPLRFLAETFGSKVHYNNLTVKVETKPLIIDGVEVKSILHEYHMTMGGIEEQLKGNAYIEEMYHLFVKNKGSKVEPPADFTWSFHSAIPGSYYKIGQYDFLNEEGNNIKRFDLYSLIQISEQPFLEKPDSLIYNAAEDQWFLYNKAASQSIYTLIDTAKRNGFVTIISNTVP